MSQSTTTATVVAPRGNGFGVAALVLGIIGLVFSWVPVFGLLLGVLAAIFGAVGYGKARGGMAIAGVVLGGITVVIGVVMLAALSSAAESVSKDLQAAPNLLPFAHNVAVPAKPAPSGPATSIDGGTYVVGSDIEAGTYRTTGSASGLPCYWARLKDTTGEFSSIITNGSPTGQATVTIKSTDGAFETAGCGTWQKVK
jgi:hypothetical protein